MKRAILSDIHANLDALEAVLSDIRAQEVDQLICLGDLVGYGKQPVECVDRAKSFDVCLLGNHDLAALCDLDDGAFEDVDKGTAHWTREQIQQHPEHWSFLCQLPRTWQDGDLLMVHGSPRNPVHEYVFPEDIHNAHKMDRIFSLVPQYCFVGHTHLPGVILQQGEFLAPDSFSGVYELGAEKTMINVGSVGLPRDNDPRPCYVILDDRSLEFRRIPLT